MVTRTHVTRYCIVIAWLTSDRPPDGEVHIPVDRYTLETDDPSSEVVGVVGHDYVEKLRIESDFRGIF